jgi:hypothetical protein
VTGPAAEIERVARDRGRMLLYDAKGNPLILFEDAGGYDGRSSARPSSNFTTSRRSTAECSRR